MNIENPNMEQANVSIYNMLGELVSVERATNNQRTVTLNADKFPAKGIYFVNVEVGNDVHVEKIVIN